MGDFLPFLAYRQNPVYFYFSMCFQYKCVSLTLRVLSTSPHGILFTKSMPVRGVPVGGSKMDASIIRYSTFRGLLYTQRNSKHVNLIKDKQYSQERFCKRNYNKYQPLLFPVNFYCWDDNRFLTPWKQDVLLSHRVTTNTKSEISNVTKHTCSVGLTIMLLYSSSNMSRKISSPCRKWNIQKRLS